MFKLMISYGFQSYATTEDCARSLEMPDTEQKVIQRQEKVERIERPS